MRITISRSIFFVFLGIVFSSTAFAQTKPIDDVVGIRLGMSAAEVRAAIKAHDPEMSIKDATKWEARPGIPASLASIEACKSKAHVINCIEKISVNFGQASKKAYFIHRNVSFNGEALHQTVVDSILKKYGKPTFPSSTTGPDMYRWLYDARDNGLANNNSGCVPSGQPPAVVHKGCGVSVDVYVPKTKGTALADTLWINVFDHRLLMENIAKEKADALEFQEKRENRAKTGKVSL